jgi:hypothetical protein
MLLVLGGELTAACARAYRGSDQLAQLRSFVALTFTQLLESCGAHAKVKIGDVECAVSQSWHDQGRMVVLGQSQADAADPNSGPPTTLPPQVRFNHEAGCSKTKIRYVVKVTAKSKDAAETIHGLVDELAAAQQDHASVCDAEDVECGDVDVGRFAVGCNCHQAVRLMPCCGSTTDRLPVVVVQVKQLHKKPAGSRLYAFTLHGKHAELFRSHPHSTSSSSSGGSSYRGSSDLDAEDSDEEYGWDNEDSEPAGAYGGSSSSSSGGYGSSTSGGYGGSSSGGYSSSSSGGSSSSSSGGYGGSSSGGSSSSSSGGYGSSSGGSSGGYGSSVGAAAFATPRKFVSIDNAPEGGRYLTAAVRNSSSSRPLETTLTAASTTAVATAAVATPAAAVAAAEPRFSSPNILQTTMPARSRHTDINRFDSRMWPQDVAPFEAVAATETAAADAAINVAVAARTQ